MILFGTPVMVYDDVLEEDYRLELLEEAKVIRQNVSDEKKNWMCDVYSTCHDYQLTEDDNFSKFLSYQQEKINHFLGVHEVGDRLFVQSSWLNAYEADSFQDVHKHPMSFLAAVYYLDAPEGSAPLTLRHPHLPDLSYNRTSGKYFAENRQIKTVTNRLVVFPGYLPHSVPRGTNKEPRWSIASNYWMENA